MGHLWGMIARPVLLPKVASCAVLSQADVSNPMTLSGKKLKMLQIPNLVIVFQNRTYRPVEEQLRGGCQGCAMDSGPNSELTTACPEFIRRQLHQGIPIPCEAWIFNVSPDPAS